MPTTGITSDQMYQIEDNGSLLGMPKYLMMENAGHVACLLLSKKFGNKIRRKRIAVVCGTGNNGGDGFVSARHLAGYGSIIHVILVGSPSRIRTEEAAMNWQILTKMTQSIGIKLAESELSDVSGIIKDADIIIDAIFGTGIKGPIGEPHATAIKTINLAEGYKLAIDIPSGIDPNSGKAHNECVRADATVTFHRMKTGLKKARRYTGQVFVEHIGIPPEAERGVI